MAATASWWIFFSSQALKIQIQIQMVFFFVAVPASQYLLVLYTGHAKSCTNNWKLQFYKNRFIFWNHGEEIPLAELLKLSVDMSPT